MLMPKKVKYRKQQRGRMSGVATRGQFVDFGDYGLMAGRIAINRFIKRNGKLWIRIFPDKPYTKKPLETRMGKGKGNVEGWVAVIKPGRILYELEGVSPETAEEAFSLAAHKLPIKTRIVSRKEQELLV